MNDFFDSLKDIKKELEKEQKIAPKNCDASSKQNLIARKQERLKAEFLDYVKNSDIRKI